MASAARNSKQRISHENDYRFGISWYIYIKECRPLPLRGGEYTYGLIITAPKGLRLYSHIFWNRYSSSEMVEFWNFQTAVEFFHHWQSANCLIYHTLAPFPWWLTHALSSGWDDYSFGIRYMFIYIQQIQYETLPFRGGDYILRLISQALKGKGLIHLSSEIVGFWNLQTAASTIWTNLHSRVFSP